MPPDVSLSDLVPLKDVPKLLPRRNGKKINVSLVYRWAKAGLDGVRLRTVKVGGVMYTAEPWIWEFLNRDNPPECGERAPTPRQRDRELDRIEAELEAKGW